ncbi:MAG: hypothetical protein V1735_00470 [Nanoarchaeota archaeon]
MAETPRPIEPESTFPWLMIGGILMAVLAVTGILLFVFHRRIGAPAGDYPHLTTYIKTQLASGYKEPAIRARLVLEGWDPEVVDRHISRCRPQEASDYIRTQMGKGYSAPAIRAKLIQAGWPPEVVDEQFKKL